MEPGIELWRLDVASDQATLVPTEGRPGEFHLTATSRLLIASPPTRRTYHPTRRETLVPYEPSLTEVDPHTGREIARVNIDLPIEYSVISPDERRMYLFHVPKSELKVVALDPITVVEKRTLPTVNSRQAHAVRAARTARLSVEGRHLYLLANGLRVFDVETMEPLYEDRDAISLAVSPDGRWLITTFHALWPEDRARPRSLTVIDATTLEEIGHFEPGARFNEPVTISADGRYVYPLLFSSAEPDLSVRTCVSACNVINVIDFERLEVIATHTYDVSPPKGGAYLTLQGCSSKDRGGLEAGFGLLGNAVGVSRRALVSRSAPTPSQRSRGAGRADRPRRRSPAQHPARRHR